MKKVSSPGVIFKVSDFIPAYHISIAMANEDKISTTGKKIE
jgi:hypothetical protein